MKFLGIHFHNWEYIFKETPKTFEGTSYKDYYKAYRRCKVCGKYEDQNGWEYSWCEMNPFEVEILKTKIKIHDKGFWYIPHIKPKFTPPPQSRFLPECKPPKA